MLSNNAVIIGSGGHAQSIMDMETDQSEINIIGYLDVKNHGEILNLPFLGTEDEFISNPKCQNVIMGISYLDSPKDRKLKNQIIERLISNNLKFPVIIGKNVTISKNSMINEGTVIFNGVIINTSTTIGKYCVINSGAVIEHHCNIHDDVFIGLQMQQFVVE